MRLLFTFMAQTGAKEKGPVNCQVFTTLMLQELSDSYMIGQGI